MLKVGTRPLPGGVGWESSKRDVEIYETAYNISTVEAHRVHDEITKRHHTEVLGEVEVELYEAKFGLSRKTAKILK